jgi:DNA (cytosine-5)-methyltransferase 1
MNYYNEWDPYRAEWLRNLIRDGLIPDGKVDERDIAEVKAEDLEGFIQCHWFTGIAGWSQAFKLAGWLPDVPVWTGSCPCQPLSCAGKREGEKDVRHLWPVFYRLICERRPPVVFGEQTASGDGPEWVAGVRLDLEAAGYRVGIANLPAACVQAPHPRARIWWVADATESRRRQPRSAGEEVHARAVQSGRRGGMLGGLADADGLGKGGSSETIQAGQSQSGGEGFWSDYQVLWRNEPKRGLVPCRAEPGIFPLASRFPTRVEQVSAYGDSIVPQTAAEFVKAFMECR